jgi:hypothetical protein
MPRLSEGFKAKVNEERGQGMNTGSIVSLIIIALLAFSVVSHTYSSVVINDE